MKPYLLAAFLVAIASLSWAVDERPNVLWITIEDWSPDLSCYGTKGIHTPHVDQLASEGIRYQWAFTTSPVCSTSRSAMMTGFHQNFIGAHMHRESNKQPLPQNIRPIPHLLRDAGYYTALMSRKTDCNFLPDDAHDLFEGKDWKERGEGQPFFARITFGGTHRSWKRDPKRPIETADVELPPYYPDNEFCRRDWANGLEQMQLVDREVGELLARLREEGLMENTLVIFIGDHGRCHIRGKQFLYDGGIRIPMIVRWPGKLEPGQVRLELVQSIDLCATVLAAAGVIPPVPLHGRDLFAEQYEERRYVFAAREKMDETHDAMRAIRSQDYKLILNLMPERPYLQYNRYKEGAYPMLAEMNILHLKGQLSPEQSAFFAPTKPEVELYHFPTDPHEIRNVADDPAHAAAKTALLAELARWRKDVIADYSEIPEEWRSTEWFPENCPTNTVDQWVLENAEEIDFVTHGWPAWYPTRSLAEWEKARALWKPYVMRAAGVVLPRPVVTLGQKAKKK